MDFHFLHCFVIRGIQDCAVSPQPQKLSCGNGYTFLHAEPLKRTNEPHKNMTGQSAKEFVT
jgi:hypothetical protein